MTNRRRMFGMAMVLVLAGAAMARAADTPAEIELQRKLDSRIDLTLNDAPLSKAFSEIAKAAGIAIQVDQACYDALPYGDTTKVNVKFRSSPVRASIDEMLMHLALEQAVSGSTLVIRPMPALLRVGRRAEWDEIKLLEFLRSTQVEGKLDQGWTAALRAQGQNDVAVEASDVDAATNDKAMAQVRAVLPVPYAQALDLYCASAGQVWTVREHTIVITTPRKWVERQLERPIVIDKKNAPLSEVVAELTHLSRVHFQPEPGLYARVPMVSLTSDNATLRRALDALTGGVGVAYEVRDDGIYLHLADKSTPKVNPIIGRVSMPLGSDNAMFDMFVYESDLPPEINELRKKRLNEAVQELRQKLKNPAPAVPAPPASTVPAATTSATTIPATRPKQATITP